jgi:hypothetical protein
MSAHPHRILAIIPAALKNTINVAVHGAIEASSAETFRIPLNASGLATDAPTHYWCAPALTDAAFTTVASLQTAFPAAQVFAWDMDAQPNFPASKLAELGLKPISAPTPH